MSDHYEHEIADLKEHIEGLEEQLRWKSEEDMLKSKSDEIEELNDIINIAKKCIEPKMFLNADDGYATYHDRNLTELRDAIEWLYIGMPERLVSKVSSITITE